MSRTLTQRALDAVFGYDFFISYTRRDGGKDYALALARRLEREGFQIFFDSDDYAMGDDWKTAGKWALHRTSQLILVASPEALSSSAVVREVEIYSTLRGRRIIPIDFGGTIRHRDETKPVFLHLKPEILFIEEHVDCLGAQPSDFVIQKLRDGFHLKRQDKKRARVFGAIAAVLVILTLLASAAAFIATAQRQLAEDRSLQIRRASGLSSFISSADAVRRNEDDMALAHLARAVQEDPENEAASTRLVTLLGQRRWPVPLRTFTQTTEIMTSPVRSLLLHQDGRRLLIESGRWGESSLQVRDWQTGRLLANPANTYSTSLLGMHLSHDGSSVLVAREAKGTRTTTLSLLPPLAGSPVQVQAPGPDEDECSHPQYRALAPSGKFAVVDDGSQLSLLPGTASPPPPDLSISFGAAQPAAPEAPLPNASTLHLPQIDSLASVIAVGCSDQAVFILGKDGALWKVQIPTPPARPAAAERMTTVVLRDGHPPAYAAFSRQGDRLAAMFVGGLDQLRIFDLSTDKLTGEGAAYAAAALLKSSADASQNDTTFSFGFLPDDSGVAFYRISARQEGGWWQLAEDEGKDKKAGQANWQWYALPSDSTLATDTRFAVVRDDAYVRILDARSGAPVCASVRHDDEVTAADVFNGTLFATGTEAGETRLWTLLEPSLAATPEIKQTTDAYENSRIWAVSSDSRIHAPSPGALAATLQHGGRTVTVDIPDWGERRRWGEFSSANFSPDTGTFVMTGSYRSKAFGGAAVFSSTTGQPVSQQLEHDGCVWAGFSPGGDQLATAGRRHVQIWNAHTYQPASTQLIHSRVTRALWLPQHTQQMLTIAEGNSLRLWDLEKATLIREVPWPEQLRSKTGETDDQRDGKGYPVIWAAFEDSGKRFMLLTGPADWNLPSFKLTLFDSATLEQLSDPIPAPQLAPDATFADAIAVFPWQEIRARPTPDALALLARTAEIIAGRRIGKDGKIAIVKDLPAELAQLAAVADQTSEHPLKTLVQKLTARPVLVELRNTSLTALAASEAAVKALFLLERALGAAEAVYSSPGTPGNLWFLNRQRLEDLSHAFAEARKLSPQTAEPLISGIYESWHKRTDPAAVLTRWHFQRQDSDREAARAVFAKEIAAALSDPETSPENKPSLLDLQKAWEADLK